MDFGAIFFGVAMRLAGKKGASHMLKVIKGPLRRGIEIRTHIEVPTENHYVRGAEPNSPVMFYIDILRQTDISLNVECIQYEVLYNDATIQRRTEMGPKAIGGTEIRSRIGLPYYPKEAPAGIPPTPDRWGIKGVATINSIYGSFLKDFASKRMLVTFYDGSWDTLRDSLS